MLLSLADSQTFDVFVPACVLIAVGGSFVFMSAFPVAFLLGDKRDGFLATISCLFDASSLIFILCVAWLCVRVFFLSCCFCLYLWFGFGCLMRD